MNAPRGAITAIRLQMYVLTELEVSNAEKSFSVPKGEFPTGKAADNEIFERFSFPSMPHVHNLFYFLSFFFSSYEATAKGCVDVNECTTKDHKCKGLAECRNEKGSYSCVCPNGYLLAPDNSCEDINECNFYLCPYNSKCINTPGSYRCECNVGFKNVNENTCHDIDECSITPGLWKSDPACFIN